MLSKKALVVEKGSGWATVMLPDGEFKRIKTNKYLEVGEFCSYSNISPAKYAAAAVLLLAFLFSSFDYFSVQAYARVSSLAELGVNRWGRVVSVKAIDPSGDKLLQKINIKNDKIEIAIEKIYTQALQDKQIISSLEPEVIYDNPGNHKPTDMEEKLQNKMTQGLQKAINKQNQKDKQTVVNENEHVINNGSQHRSTSTENNASSLIEPESNSNDSIAEETAETMQNAYDKGKTNGSSNQQEKNTDKINEIKIKSTDLLESSIDKEKTNHKGNGSKKDSE